MTAPDSDLRQLLNGLSPAQIGELVADLPPEAADVLLEELGGLSTAYDNPASPVALAELLYEGNFSERPHLAYLSERIGQAVADVEAGTSRKLVIQLPPRSGKTTMTTLLAPTWMLSRHPSWPIALTSHDGQLATSWGRQIRRWAEAGALGSQVLLARDAGAVGSWETTEGGKMLSLSIRESFTGRGAKVIIIDDPHKDFVDAHSETMRQNVWDWWLSVAQTRLEPPSLVVVVMTRWHEDDLVGRLLSEEYEGDPSDWEVISLPAIAEEDDPLGRAPGDPLYSPLIEETREEALQRWAEVEQNVGTYVWTAMYQQRPGPATGAIFNSDWWRFWTSDPARETEDGRTKYVDLDALPAARWLDSWDAAFKGSATSDYVVGQRWVRSGQTRYLVAQQRGRWSFTETIERMKEWGPGKGPYGNRVHLRLIEEAANGAAIIDSLKEKISGIRAIRAVVGKEMRARAITPEVESGHVRLPHPGDPGNEWVVRLLSELRNFPRDAHDDQVDALTQALTDLRDWGSARVISPLSEASRPATSGAAAPKRRRGISIPR